jgi:6-phosphogluconolactonase
MLFTYNANVIVYKNISSLSLAAAEIFIQIAKNAIHDRQRVLVALSGGSTPKRLFRLFSSPPYALSLPWSQIHFFWCDERLVSTNHPESNFGQAFDLLFSQVNIPNENLHRIRGEAIYGQAAEEYSKLLEVFSDGDLNWPRFDLVFLGLGADGHTASLFPGAITPEEKESPVLAVKLNYQDRPVSRITLTPLALNSARNLIFMVSGKDKAHAVIHSLNGPTDLEKWPAQRIQLLDGKLIWLLDDDAASN